MGASSGWDARAPQHRLSLRCLKRFFFEAKRPKQTAHACSSAVEDVSAIRVSKSSAVLALAITCGLVLRALFICSLIKRSVIVKVWFVFIVLALEVPGVFWWISWMIRALPLCLCLCVYIFVRLENKHTRNIWRENQIRYIASRYIFRAEGKKCHAKSMMSREPTKLKINTQHVPLRQNAEEKTT